MDKLPTGQFTLFEIRYMMATFVPKSREKSNREWVWKMNIDAMLDQIDITTRFDIGGDYLPYNGPSYLIRAGNSVHINDEDLGLIYGLCPNTKVITIEGASHHMHSDKPQETVGSVAAALAEVDSEPLFNCERTQLQSSYQ